METKGDFDCARGFSGKSKKNKKITKCKVCGDTISLIFSPYEKFDLQREAIFSGFCSTRCKKFKK